MEMKTFIEWLRNPKEDVKQPVQKRFILRCSNCQKPIPSMSYSGMCDFCYSCMMAATF